MNVLLTGATGLIGKEVGKVLAEKGHTLYVISRDRTKARNLLPFPCEIIVGDLMKGPLTDPRLKDIEGVINLMGEPVVGSRWNAPLKEKIYNSRVLGTRHLIRSLPGTVETFVSGSAIGFYGDCGDEICHEDHPPGEDFLAQVTSDWEKEASTAPGRVSFIRTGIVLSPQGGALEQMLFPFKAGVGGKLGNGHQWMSWIHIQDIVGLLVFALEKNHVQGALNGVAPNPVTNEEFSKTLAESLGRPLGLAVPKTALKALYGEGAAAILSSIRGSADHVLSLGYRFQHTDLKEVLGRICAPFKTGEEVFYGEQYIPKSPEELFDFFKDPHNLEKITPPTLSFEIGHISTPQIQQGTLIDYNLKIHGIPVKWKTEITEWAPPHKFVDTQLRGPYQFWHHTHEFRPFCGGTLMVDQVRYRLPLGAVGWLTGNSFVKKDVARIFQFRREYIRKFTEKA